ncbi:unnamed protein product [Orchesella dallaii]|uniref:Uncharacterized protein n=1 Tax=Orchesella dallaii TaxID=48710 RepID=A0ABP1QR72_9HEXA
MQTTQQKQAQNVANMGDSIVHRVGFHRAIANATVQSINNAEGAESLSDENVISNQNLTDGNENNSPHEETLQGIKRTVGDGSEENEKKRSRTFLNQPDTMLMQDKTTTCFIQNGKAERGNGPKDDTDLEDDTDDSERDTQYLYKNAGSHWNYMLNVFQSFNVLQRMDKEADICKHCEINGVTRDKELKSPNDLTEHQSD